MTISRMNYFESKMRTYLSSPRLFAALKSGLSVGRVQCSVGRFAGRNLCKIFFHTNICILRFLGKQIAAGLPDYCLQETVLC